MKQAGHSTVRILGLWSAVVAASAASALIGYLFLANASGDVIAAIQAFAAGAS